MNIGLAEILKYLKSGRGVVAKVAKDTGINQDALYKWKDGRGKPSGDEMVKLVDYVTKLDVIPNDPAETWDTELKTVPLNLTIRDYFALLNRYNRALEKFAGLDLSLENNVTGSPGNSQHSSGDVDSPVKPVRKRVNLKDPSFSKQ